MDRDFTLRGEHTVQCTEGVWWNCIPGTCVILLANVIQTNSIKREKKMKWDNVIKAPEPHRTCKYI